jgi:uncharacterized protein DUF6600/FecR-like protein
MSSKALSRFAFAAILSLLISLSAFADSHVRIVRLSYMEGGVQIDRNTGQFEKAIVNLPITEGAKLRTEANGRAEIEFEDGSTLRLAPETTVQFPELSLRDSGTKISVVDIQSGTAYVDFVGAKNNELTLQFGDEKAVLTHATHFRIGEGKGGAELAVFKGEVQVEAQSGSTQVKKNQTADFGNSDNAQVKIAKELEPEPLDSWDKEQTKYHQTYASRSYGNYSPYAYGTNDLSYYGTFFSAPGYGMVWQPYFIGADWNPFMDGAWAFSPGFGYGWVSSYPWGWTPYHYGSWAFLPGYGWAWQPGGAWMPWYSQPQLVNRPTGFRPPQAPSGMASKGRTIVSVNRGPVSNLQGHAGNRIEIRNNSAGLGVPRGRIPNLAKVSHEVQQRGTVMQRVHTAAVTQSQHTPSIQRSEAGRAEPSGSRSAAPRSSAPQRQMSAPASSPRMSAPAPSPSGGGRRR